MLCQQVYVVVVVLLVSRDVQRYINGLKWLQQPSQKALLDKVFAVLDLLIVACVESYIYTQSPNSKTLGSSIKAESQLAAALWCTLQFLYI